MHCLHKVPRSRWRGRDQHSESHATTPNIAQYSGCVNALIRQFGIQCQHGISLRASDPVPGGFPDKCGLHILTVLMNLQGFQFIGFYFTAVS
jgi:hypothetical protein